MPYHSNMKKKDNEKKPKSASKGKVSLKIN